MALGGATTRALAGAALQLPAVAATVLVLLQQVQEVQPVVAAVKSTVEAQQQPPIHKFVEQS